MSKRQSVNLQPSFVLKRRKYRESSLLLTVFTLDHGKLTLIAKGAMNDKSRRSSILQPFLPLNLSFSGGSDMKVLTGAETTGLQIRLEGTLLYCGYYLCELIDLFLQPSDAHPTLFMNFSRRMEQLGDGQPPNVILRYFEIELLEDVGYGLQLELEMQQMSPIKADAYYDYQPHSGPVESNNETFLKGSTLIALKQKKITDYTIQKEAKLLLKTIIDFHLEGKVLQSRQALTKLLKEQHSMQSKSDFPGNHEL